METPAPNRVERLAIIGAERDRLAHGLYAAQVDLIVSKASPGDAGRLQTAEARLADVEARIETCEQLRAAVEAEPE
jgi:hypothetical protein